MIRKCSLREAPLAHCTETSSLLIFSGAIVLTAQTIEIVPWIQGKEKSCHASTQIPTCTEMGASDRPARV